MGILWAHTDAIGCTCIVSNIFSCSVGRWAPGGPARWRAKQVQLKYKVLCSLIGIEAPLNAALLAVTRWLVRNSLLMHLCRMDSSPVSKLSIRDKLEVNWEDACLNIFVRKHIHFLSVWRCVRFLQSRRVLTSNFATVCLPASLQVELFILQLYNSSIYL